MTNDGIYDLTFLAFFNGGFGITGASRTGQKTLIASTKINGSNNYKPSKIYNNSSVNKQTTLFLNAFIHSPVLGDTTDFKGKGNQYIGGKIVFGADTVFFWVLINLNAKADALHILKIAYENDYTAELFTGTEGSNNPTNNVHNLTNNSVFYVYPQPAKECINIDINMKINSMAIYSLSGQLLKMENNITQNKMNVSDLNSGIYLLNIITENGTAFRKIYLE
ncbi:MAG: T9SS type A sorting domain-containing protein [Bacteroidetes bacterium]|nr:T9SS type A sorting domain-containing protein [Bacteroidota bacterium]